MLLLQSVHFKRRDNIFYEILQKLILHKKVLVCFSGNKRTYVIKQVLTTRQVQMLIIPKYKQKTHLYPQQNLKSLFFIHINQKAVASL